MAKKKLADATAAIRSALRAFQAGEKAKALAGLDQSIRLLPNRSRFWGAEQDRRLKGEFFYWRALLAFSCERLLQAKADAHEAVQCAPDLAQLFALKAEIHKGLGEHTDAIKGYESAIALAPDHVAWRYNLALCFECAQQWERALACYDRVLEQDPAYLAALNQKALLLQSLGERQAAQSLWTALLAIDPNDLPARLNRALMWLESEPKAQAQSELEALLRADPNLTQARIALGSLHLAEKRPEMALGYLEDAFEKMPDAPFLLGQLMMCCLLLADWSRLPELQARLTQALAAGKPACTPFSLLALVDEPAWHLQAGKQFVDLTIRAAKRIDEGALRKAGPDERIRVGYFSSDLHEHATAYLIAQLIETHDRAAFDIYLFSYGKATEDPMQIRLRQAADHWVDIASASDKQVRELVGDCGVEIAVDLKGYTYLSRPSLFAQRLAPVHVSYLGYPGSLGSSAMDYVVVDRVLVADTAEAASFTEHTVRLPVSYQVNDACWQADAAVAMQCEGLLRERLRRDQGLDPEAMVYCCFNNTYKVTPQVFSDWMAILQAVPQSQLWLLQDSEPATHQFQAQAKAKGVDPRRLVFAQRVPRPQHLWRHGLADLFLDTFPYNAHTTASDALRCGMPLVTRMGRSFASRVSASLLEQLGMSSLITKARDDYRLLAIALGQDPGLLAAFRDKLAAALKASALFDASGVRPWLEQAYRIMAQRAREGASLQPIDLLDYP